jgi:hypothetical protein
MFQLLAFRSWRGARHLLQVGSAAGCQKTSWLIVHCVARWKVARYDKSIFDVDMPG